MKLPRIAGAAVVLITLIIVCTIVFVTSKSSNDKANSVTKPTETTTSSPTATPTPTPTVDPAAAPKGDLPGWKQQYLMTFSKNAGLGDIEKVYGTAFTGYSGFFDHANNGVGLYAPLRVLSAKNGYLDYYLHTENSNPLIAAVTPDGYTGQKYGRYTVRFKSDLAPGYRVAFLLWPDGEESADLWKKGEIDFPEVNLIEKSDPVTGLTPSINGFSHDTNGNPKHNSLRYITGESAQEWHTATIEWTPTKLTFTLDGHSMSTTDPVAIPKVKMHWVLQTQTSSTKRVKPGADVSGHVYIDWIAQYSYDPDSK